MNGVTSLLWARLGPLPAPSCLTSRLAESGSRAVRRTGGLRTRIDPRIARKTSPKVGSVGGTGNPYYSGCLPAAWMPCNRGVWSGQQVEQIGETRERAVARASAGAALRDRRWSGEVRRRDRRAPVRRAPVRLPGNRR